MGIHLFVPNLNKTIDELLKEGQILKESINSMQDKKEIDVNSTFTGLLASKNDLVPVLESALFFKLKWTVYIKKKLFRENYYVVLSGDYAKYFGHYFKKYERSSVSDINKLREWYYRSATR